MPIHRDILYDSATGAHECGQGSELRVDLVQHATVKHDDSYVEEIIIIYSPNAAGEYPDDDFTLTLVRDDILFKYTPVIATYTPPDNKSDWRDDTTGSVEYTVVFKHPEANGTKLFEFGTASGPPTKLKVKVKRQPTIYSC